MVRWIFASTTPAMPPPRQTTDKTPLLTRDVWEHARDIDYRNSRPNRYPEALLLLVNWDGGGQALLRSDSG